MYHFLLQRLEEEERSFFRARECFFVQVALPFLLPPAVHIAMHAGEPIKSQLLFHQRFTLNLNR